MRIELHQDFIPLDKPRTNIVNMHFRPREDRSIVRCKLTLRMGFCLRIRADGTVLGDIFATYILWMSRRVPALG